MTPSPTGQAARAAAREKAARAMCRALCQGYQVHVCDTESDSDGRVCKPDKCPRWQEALPASNAAIDAYRAALPPANVEAEKLLEQAKEAFEFIDLALQYEDQNQILRSGVRMAEVRARAHTLLVEIKRLEK